MLEVPIQLYICVQNIEDQFFGVLRNNPGPLRRIRNQAILLILRSIEWSRSDGKMAKIAQCSSPSGEGLCRSTPAYPHSPATTALCGVIEWRVVAAARGVLGGIARCPRTCRVQGGPPVHHPRTELAPTRLARLSQPTTMALKKCACCWRLAPGPVVRKRPTRSSRQRTRCGELEQTPA